MSQKNNIYKINNKKDLSSFFKKNGNDKHIMLSVILSTTSDIIKNMILSFMKDKSEIYPNVFFILLVIEEEDIGTIANSFPRKKTEYPYIIYIYNNVEKLVDITSVTTLKALRESFSVIAEYYDETNEEMTRTVTTIDSKSSSNNNNDTVYENNNNNNTIQENNNEEIDYLEESKKMADKILLLIELKKKHDISFIKDLKKKKKKEKNEEESDEKPSKKSRNDSSKNKKK
jgi:hypothetical protein